MDLNETSLDLKKNGESDVNYRVSVNALKARCTKFHTCQTIMFTAVVNVIKGTQPGFLKHEGHTCGEVGIMHEHTRTFTHPGKPIYTDLRCPLCVHNPLTDLLPSLCPPNTPAWPAPQLCGGWSEAPGGLSWASLETAVRGDQPAPLTTPHYHPPSLVINLHGAGPPGVGR